MAQSSRTSNFDEFSRKLQHDHWRQMSALNNSSHGYRYCTGGRLCYCTGGRLCYCTGGRLCYCTGGRLCYCTGGRLCYCTGGRLCYDAAFIDTTIGDDRYVDSI